MRKAHVFLAGKLKAGKTQRDKTEQQKTCPMSRNKAYSKLFKGEIKHSATIIALAMASPLLNLSKTRAFTKTLQEAGQKPLTEP